MQSTYFEGQVFDPRVTNSATLVKGEYENCEFKNLSMIDTDLSGYSFVECSFTECDLSNARVDQTSFKTVEFKKCKLQGIRFDCAQKMLLAFSFDECNLSYSSFYTLKIKGTRFKDSMLKNVDFADGDLTKSIFQNCDLEKAIFENTNLEHADFATAYNFIIDPETNRIKKTVFSMQGLPGLLSKLDLIIRQ